MNDFTARETGTTAARGTAFAEDFARIQDPTKGLVPKSLETHLKLIDPREFLLDRKFLPHISDVALEAELIRINDHGKTRGESGHAVLFGQLLLRGEDEGEHSLHVAVKPLDTTADAVKEYAISGYMADGNINSCETFKPLGFMRTRNGKPAIITHYRHPVRSMDGIFWNPDLVHEDSIVNKALGRAAIAIARFHSAGWVHGDYEAKNAAWDVTSAQDKSFMIDLEQARPVYHETREIQDRTKWQDLDVFIGSLQRLREVGYEMPAGFADRVKEHFGLVYTGTRDSLGRSESRIQFETIARMVDNGDIA